MWPPTYRSNTVSAMGTPSLFSVGLKSLNRPVNTAETLDVGVQAVHSVPLKLRGEMIGALNLLRTEPGHVAQGDAKELRALFDVPTPAFFKNDCSTRRPDASGLQPALVSGEPSFTFSDQIPATPSFRRSLSAR